MKQITTSPQYRLLLQLFHSALTYAKPAHLFPEKITLCDGHLVIRDAFNLSYQCKLDRYNRIFVTGIGKATASMASALETILGDRITDGHIIVKYGHQIHPLKTIKVTEASHPLPDESGLRGTQQILGIADNSKKNDLIINLISGGGSALLVHPTEPVSLHDLRIMTDLLLRCGAAIHEINCIRKHISDVKGGKLLKRTYPAKTLSLIISDVIGDSLDVIASGPTAVDTSTSKNAIQIIEKYHLTKTIPSSIMTVLEKGIFDINSETLKKTDIQYRKVTNIILFNNDKIIERIETDARQNSLKTVVLQDKINGNATVESVRLARLAKKIKSDKSIQKPVCLISGGETTVTIKGNGKGGRNQEFALSFGIEIADIEGISLLSCGTDGTDGPTDATGAFVNSHLIEISKKKNIEPRKYLNNNDSYHFFEKTGGLIKTGPTETNVMDIQIVLIE